MVATATRSRGPTLSLTNRWAASCARDIERGEVKPRSKRRTKERRAAGFIGAIALAGASVAAKSTESNDVIGCFFLSSYSAKFGAARPRTGLPEASSTDTGSSMTWTLIVEVVCDVLCASAEIATSDAAATARNRRIVRYGLST